METRQVTILDGSTFVVSDVQGDFQAGPDEPQGFFYRDMRHLSTWRLLLDGRALDALATDEIAYDAAVFFLVVPTGSVYENPSLSVTRRRYVGDGLREELVVRNFGPLEVSVQLSMVFGADFADIFEVKDHQPKIGQITVHTSEHGAVLQYRRGDFTRQTVISAPGALVARGALTFPLILPASGSWSGEIDVAVGEGDRQVRPKQRAEASPSPNMAVELTEWLAQAPQLVCDWDDLRRIYARSLEDLAALRFYPDVAAGGVSLPAAGLPWFMALFGRDSIIASYQALPFVPELAATTLRALADRQALTHDDFRDAEPGKILHELRFGELTYFRQRPQSPYYGSADATPLFLILLDEYERWTGDQDLIRALEPAARAALRWIEDYGDLDGDGYLEYQRRNTATGLINQCWKDSWNSVVHPDGSLASLPRGTCELQGYAYDARIRTARLAREVWNDPNLAARLEADAATLKQRFNNDFWVEDQQFYALALDGHKRPVATVTSNPGHLLWSGIVDDDRSGAVAARLMREDLFSGWGVRTLAAGQPAFSPLEYHNGTVWPHDNALIAAGLARYGHHEPAGLIALATLEAACSFDYRLPEVFAGYARSDTGFPVPFPTACSPQAWAAGTPLLLIRVLLGLQPAEGAVTTEPHLPAELGTIQLTNVAARPGGIRHA